MWSWNYAGDDRLLNDQCVFCNLDRNPIHVNDSFYIIDSEFACTENLQEDHLCNDCIIERAQDKREALIEAMI